MVGHEGSSAGSYLADPTSPIPSHCASIVATSTLRVNILTLSPPRVQMHIRYKRKLTAAAMRGVCPVLSATSTSTSPCVSKSCTVLRSPSCAACNSLLGRTLQGTPPTTKSSVTVLCENKSSVWRQKGLTGYCFKYTDRPFCLQTND